MKKSAISLLTTILLISTTASSIEPSHYDTSTHVLSIPNLVIKDNKGNDNPPKIYEETKLLLNLDGTWKALNLDANPHYLDLYQQIEGYWEGRSSGYLGDFCFNPAPDSHFRIRHYRISLITNGTNIHGIVAGSGSCTTDTIGTLIGEITDQKKISFSIEFDGKEYIEFKGKISDNFSKIEGSIEYKESGTSYTGEKEDLSLSLN